MARVWPERAAQITFESAAAIRTEIARAIPLYKGIEKLNAKGDQVQWGGPTLYANGRFATPDGKAHFTVPQRLTAEGAEDADQDGFASSANAAFNVFRVSTRRGKQFNSMVHRDVDPLTGARRNDVLISVEDIGRLRLGEGADVELRSTCGTFRGRLRTAPILPGNLEVHWPEGNALLSASRIDPDSMEPDYNAVVTLAAFGKSEV